MGIKFLDQTVFFSRQNSFPQAMFSFSCAVSVIIFSVAAPHLGQAGRNYSMGKAGKSNFFYNVFFFSCPNVCRCQRLVVCFLCPT